MAEATIVFLLVGYAGVVVWVFLVSYRLNMARGGRSIAGCFVRALVAAYFAYIMAPYYLYRMLAARRRLNRVKAGEPLGEVHRQGIIKKSRPPGAGPRLPRLAPKIVTAYVSEVERRLNGLGWTVGMIASTHSTIWEMVCGSARTGFASPDDVWAAEYLCISAAEEHIGLTQGALLNEVREECARKMWIEVMAADRRTSKSASYSATSFSTQAHQWRAQADRMGLQETEHGPDLYAALDRLNDRLGH